jgi:lipopolysaccharide transport protein LptA
MAACVTEPHPARASRPMGAMLLAACGVLAATVQAAGSNPVPLRNTPAPAPAGREDANAAGIVIGGYEQLTVQPGKVQLQPALITEQDARGRALKSIRAERAESTGLDASNSTWNFYGNVTVTLAEGQMHADRATVLIARGRISTATVTGAPANFEQRGAEGGAVIARGRANDIRYDATGGDLVFTGDVWFDSESTGEISSSRATYNIPARTSSFEKGVGGRVRGTIRLKSGSGGEPERTQ